MFFAVCITIDIENESVYSIFMVSLLFVTFNSVNTLTSYLDVSISHQYSVEAK